MYTSAPPTHLPLLLLCLPGAPNDLPLMVVSRPQHLVEGVDDGLEGVMGGRGWVRGGDGW